MRIALSHLTRLEYPEDVVESVMDARLGPHTDEDQRWERYALDVAPTGAVRRYADAFGNVAHLITVARPHGAVEIVMSGEVHTLLDDPFRPPPARPAPLGPVERADYLDPSPLVPHDAELAALAGPGRPADPDDAFVACQRLTRIVYERFTYEPDVTTVATTVRDVLAERTGVCQDFAHVLIGLCRVSGIPARYVSGYIVIDAEPDAPHRGDRASHAWVEAYTPTHGWRGFDPTNDLVANDHYVKMAIGRDYRDVPPTRGTFRGQGDERLAVEVVTRLAP
ncbi:MAG: transglutaminase family protein [Candidatus Limnocylindria bacterium]